MKRFAQLFAELDASTATSAKVAALRRYFAGAPAEDAAWAVYFLAGGKPRQIVPSRALAEIACREAGIPPWLFEASYQAVGDLAETVAHVLPAPSREGALGLAAWMETRLLPLRGAGREQLAQALAQWWQELDFGGRFLLGKLIGGGFRVGVSKLLVQRALAETFAIDGKRIAQRMMGYTDGKAMPDATRFRALVAPESASGADPGQPYPFFLAHSLAAPPAELAAKLGPPGDWIVEWKYDGIRAQVIKRGHRVWIWSRGEELVTDRFPEIVAAAGPLPDGSVLDGEIVAMVDGRTAPFQLLQKRIGRKTLTARVQAEAPAVFVAFDVLERAGKDQRDWPLSVRRERLAQILLETPGLRLSPAETASEWAGLAALRDESRDRGVEGLMLKQRDSRYGVGRRKQDDLAGGTWWKWKIEPLRVDAVLVYAQAGHGRRASLYTDYTFAVWSRTPRDAAEADAVAAAIARREPPSAQGLALVPFAKAYAGLTDAEIADVDRIVRRTTVDRFGPVRSVRPTLVAELGFEGINRSTRHRSGIAVRFPRMLRLRYDKPLHEADSLATLEALLPAAPRDRASALR